jgi:predicted nucleotidyltransferase
MSSDLKLKYKLTIEQIKKYRKLDQVVAGYIFGSYASNTLTPASDLDVHIIDESINNRKYENIIIKNIEVDISFDNLENTLNYEKRLIAGNIQPWIENCIVLFDKSNIMEFLKKEVLLALNQKKEEGYDKNFLVQTIGKINKKIQNTSKISELNCLMCMHASIRDVVNMLYIIHNQYIVSAKKQFDTISNIDPIFTNHLQKFLAEGNVYKKLEYWDGMINNLREQINNKMPVFK